MRICREIPGKAKEHDLNFSNHLLNDKSKWYFTYEYELKEKFYNRRETVDIISFLNLPSCQHFID